MTARDDLFYVLSNERGEGAAVRLLDAFEDEVLERAKLVVLDHDCGGDYDCYCVPFIMDAIETLKRGKRERAP